MKNEIPNDSLLIAYLKPTWYWIADLQNDFAARADWCVKSYEEANHHPVVFLNTPLDIVAKPGQLVTLDASASVDPDGDELTFKWWQYAEACTYKGRVSITNENQSTASFKVPLNAKKGQTLHIICEVSDDGTPSLKHYQRVVVTVD